jgi:hypothetical protein
MVIPPPLHCRFLCGNFIFDILTMKYPHIPLFNIFSHITLSHVATLSSTLGQWGTPMCDHLIFFLTLPSHAATLSLTLGQWGTPMCDRLIFFLTSPSHAATMSSSQHRAMPKSRVIQFSYNQCRPVSPIDGVISVSHHPSIFPYILPSQFTLPSLTPLVCPPSPPSSKCPCSKITMWVAVATDCIAMFVGIARGCKVVMCLIG